MKLKKLKLMQNLKMLRVRNKQMKLLQQITL